MRTASERVRLEVPVAGPVDAMTTIRFDIPAEIEDQLGGSARDLSREAKEAFWLTLYRRPQHHDRISFSSALRLGRIETERFSRSAMFLLDLSIEQLRAEVDALRKAPSERRCSPTVG